MNEWNNIDGSIERGYGGRWIFWEEGHIRDDLARVNDSGRLLASLGMNGISINNVNAIPARAVRRIHSHRSRVSLMSCGPWGVEARARD